MLGDKQTRRDVFIMVYGVPSYLLYLLATGILFCFYYISGMLDIWLATFDNLLLLCINMSEQHQWCQTKLYCGLTKFRLLSKSYFHPCNIAWWRTIWRKDNHHLMTIQQGLLEQLVIVNQGLPTKLYKGNNQDFNEHVCMYRSHILHWLVLWEMFTIL